MIYQKEVMLSLAVAIFLTACGGSSSGSAENTLPTSGIIGDGGSSPAPVITIPDQPQNDVAALTAFALEDIYSSAQGTQRLLNIDLSNNKILIALASPNQLQLLDVNNLAAPTLIVSDNFATSIIVNTGKEDDDHDNKEHKVRPLDDDDDDDDDDHNSITVFPNTLVQASFDTLNSQNIWAIVPYRAPTLIETELGIGFSSQYGVYTGAESLLSVAEGNSENFSRSTTQDADGNIRANTGYIQRTIQSANGRMFGWQVYKNTVGRDEFSLVEMNNQAAVIDQSSVLVWSPNDQLIHWAVDKDGEKLALVTKNNSAEYYLHLLDVRNLSQVSMQNSFLMRLSGVASSAEIVRDVVFFDSSKAIAIAMANRVDVFDVTQTRLSKQSSLSFSNTVAALASHVKRGFLAVLHGDEIELLSVENPSNQVSHLQLSQAYSAMTMEEKALVLYSPTQYQLFSF